MFSFSTKTSKNISFNNYSLSSMSKNFSSFSPNINLILFPILSTLLPNTVKYRAGVLASNFFLDICDRTGVWIKSFYRFKQESISLVKAKLFSLMIVIL